MAENVTKVPVKQEKIKNPHQRSRRGTCLKASAMKSIARFDDFGRGMWQPFRRSLFPMAPSFRGQVKWPMMPAVDVVESENAYEITAELPGMDEKNIEVKVGRRCADDTGTAQIIGRGFPMSDYRPVVVGTFTKGLGF